MNRPGRSQGQLISWKDEPLAVEAGAADTEEPKAAPIAVLHRDTDAPEHSAAKAHYFDRAEALAGDALGLLGPDILNPKGNFTRVPLTIQPSAVSQRYGG